MAPEKNTEMYAVRLLKNYHPVGKHEVIFAAEGPYAGVGSGKRLWAGSIVKFSKDEAIDVLKRKAAERADELAMEVAAQQAKDAKAKDNA